VIGELRRLAAHMDFRWGVFVGALLAAAGAGSLVCLMRRRVGAALVLVFAAGVVVLAVIERSDSAQLGAPRFRWGVVVGALIVLGLVACAVLVAKRRMGAAAALACLLGVAAFSLGDRGGFSDLAHNSGFRRAMVVAIPFAIIACAVAMFVGRRGVAIAGYGVAAAVLASVAVVDHAPAGLGALFGACALLAAAGALVDHLPIPRPTRMLAFVPGALVVGVAVHERDVASHAALAALVVFVACWWWAAPPASGWCAEPALLAVTFAGIYVCVPETAVASVCLGGALPFVVTGWPLRALANGPGVPAVLGLVIWVAFVEGQGRPGAVVGAIGCVGLFALQPFVVRRRGAAHPGVDAIPPSATLLVHLLLVVWCARVAGLQQSAALAAVLACLGIATAVVVLRFIARPARTAAI
jgi:hypothetical protein